MDFGIVEILWVVWRLCSHASGYSITLCDIVIRVGGIRDIGMVPDL